MKIAKYVCAGNLSPFKSTLTEGNNVGKCWKQLYKKS